MILAESLFFRHQGADADALSDVSFRLPPGAFPSGSLPSGGLRPGCLCSLLGVNGSGKSTLLGMLAGVYVPASGRLRVAGHELPGETDALRGKVALVPQDPDVYILGSLVEEDLLLSLDPKDDAARQRALAFADTFGLSSVLQRPVHMLSYGQKRKLCLASALASSPELLLLDEPFAGLDHPAVLTVRETLTRNKADGITQVITGHDLDLMADLADVFVVLDAGRMICMGGTDEVFPMLADVGVRPPCWWFSGTARPLWRTQEKKDVL